MWGFFDSDKGERTEPEKDWTGIPTGRDTVYRDGVKVGTREPEMSWWRPTGGTIERDTSGNATKVSQTIDGGIFDNYDSKRVEKDPKTGRVTAESFHYGSRTEHRKYETAKPDTGGSYEGSDYAGSTDDKPYASAARPTAGPRHSADDSRSSSSPSTSSNRRTVERRKRTENAILILGTLLVLSMVANVIIMADLAGRQGPSTPVPTAAPEPVSQQTSMITSSDGQTGNVTVETPVTSRSDRLCDLNPVTNESVSIDRDTKFSIAGIVFDDAVYEANGNNGTVTYDLGQTYRSFDFWVGIGDMLIINPQMTSDYSVALDGQTVYSGAVSKHARATNIRLDVSGVRSLTITLTNHTVLANARLSTTPVPPNRRHQITRTDRSRPSSTSALIDYTSTPTESADRFTLPLVRMPLVVALNPSEAMPSIGQVGDVMRSGQVVAHVSVTGQGVRRYMVIGDIPKDIFSGHYSIRMAESRN